MIIVYSMGGMTFPKHPKYEDTVAQYHTDAELRSIFETGQALLVLEGGADINPAIYAQQNRHSYVNLRRDAWEVYLYTLAKEYDVPMLGICRGHQLIAAMEGGTLYQDIGIEHGADHNWQHSIVMTQDAIDCGFRTLMESCPLGTTSVNSMHHQGIHIMPPDGVVLARSEDGLVEAVKYARALTVQWHPEVLRHMQFLDYMENTFVQGA
jgi:gamma-glutamyl-gamma-aminobutyrate hydrolase PuuD